MSDGCPSNKAIHSPVFASVGHFSSGQTAADPSPCLRRSPPPPQRRGTAGGKNAGNRRFFLTGRRFESQDFAGPVMAIAHASECQSSAGKHSQNSSVVMLLSDRGAVVDVGLPDFRSPEAGMECRRRGSTTGRERNCHPLIAVCAFVVGNLSFDGNPAP